MGCRDILFRGAGLDRDRVPVYRGRGYSLFKTLYSSYCRMDCLYCPFSIHSRYEKASWSTDELVRTFNSAVESGRVEGLFLTSSLFGDPDLVVEREIEVLSRVRRTGFRGYIHVRLMPGVSKSLLSYAAVLADRAGLNVEAPESTFYDIAPSKADWMQDIVKRIEWLVQLKRRFRREGAGGSGMLRSGIDTQFVLGASSETDLEVLETAWMLLRIGVDRIYISRFRPFKTTPLSGRRPESPLRALRVMQAIELMRVYGYSIDDLKMIINEDGMLPKTDPKVAYAGANPNLYPVDLNTAGYKELLKVPGIGPRSARAIIKARESGVKLTSSFIRGVLGDYRFRRASRYIVF